MGKRAREPDPPSAPASPPPPPPAPSSALPSSLADYRTRTLTRFARFHPPPAALSPSAYYSLDPVFSIPHSTNLHAFAAPPCSSHLYTAGQDGYVRRYALYPTLNGTGVDNPLVPNLTSKQGGHERPPGTDLRQPVLSAYWENEEPGEWADELLNAPGAGKGSGMSNEERQARVRWGPKTAALGPQSAVYSLAVQKYELWGLSGTSKGSINLFTIRHDEGQIRHVFRPSAASSKGGHAPKAAVSVLALDGKREQSFLSGGWDGRIFQWDLNTGSPTRAYNAHSSQISSLAYRPLGSSSSSSLPGADGDAEMADGSGAPSGRIRTDEAASEGDADGDADADADADADGEADADADGEEDDPSASSAPAASSTAVPGTSSALNPHSSLPPRPSPSSSVPLASPSSRSPSDEPLPELSEDVFLSTGLDGTVLLWDRRVREGKWGGVRRFEAGGRGGKMADVRCQAACWSPSGLSFYVARRSTSIDIYDLRFSPSLSPSSTSHSSSSASPFASLSLPASTGPVTALAPLPSANHLLSASFDAVRLWDVDEAVKAAQEGSARKKGGMPKGARVVPGHHGGTVSALHVDPTCRFLFSTSGTRGWEGQSTETLVISEIKVRATEEEE
ncbi:hypothetical protein JCM8097_006941 [Rhodosporidiobolus ruineniae]